MTREEYHARKEQQEHKKRAERENLMAGKGSIDLPFLLLVLLLTAIGLTMLFSASFPSALAETGDALFYLKKQGLFAAMGLVAMFIVGKLNYQRWRGAALLTLGFSVFLLILVIIPGVGITENNATRWLPLPGIGRFQPSELAKVSVILYFADSISKKRERMLDFKQGVVPYMVILGVIALLMLLEPHLSGTILIVGTGAIMMVIGGIPAWLTGLGIGGAAMVAVSYVKLVEAGIMKYGAGRILMWKDPWIDPTYEGYQMVQSLIAIGSGGVLGAGLGRGSQKFRFLPEEHNDFIFAIVCEELGLIGATVIMFLFALLIIRGYWISLHARDRFGALLSAGITTQMALQTFLNMAVVTGLVPATGISLPFFSYGGTALIIQLVEMGLILSVSRQIPAPKNG